MSTLKTMTLDELRETPLTKEQKQAIRSAAKKAKSGKTTEDPDCPKMTKEELAEFRPWREVHPEWYKPKRKRLSDENERRFKGPCVRLKNKTKKTLAKPLDKTGGRA